MIEINLQSYPKHRVNLLDEQGFIMDSKEVDSGLEVVRELTKHDNVFDNIKHQRRLDLACRLFKPTKIRIKENEK